MKDYDKTLLNVLGSELKSRYRAQRIISRMPFLLDVLFLAGKNNAGKKLIQKRL